MLIPEAHREAQAAAPRGSPHLHQGVRTAPHLQAIAGTGRASETSSETVGYGRILSPPAASAVYAPPSRFLEGEWAAARRAPGPEEKREQET